jgi:predicted nucleic acid-binding protein
MNEAQRAVVLDACVVIAHFEANDAHHERATKLLEGIADRQLEISTLTLAEVLVGAVRNDTESRVEQFLRELNVTTRGLGGAMDATELAHLRVHSGLKMPDCMVLHLAKSPWADVATFDDRLARAARDHQLLVIDS